MILAGKSRIQALIGNGGRISERTRLQEMRGWERIWHCGRVIASLATGKECGIAEG